MLRRRAGARGVAVEFVPAGGSRAPAGRMSQCGNRPSPNDPAANHRKRGTGRGHVAEFRVREGMGRRKVRTRCRRAPRTHRLEAVVEAPGESRTGRRRRRPQHPLVPPRRHLTGSTPPRPRTPATMLSKWIATGEGRAGMLGFNPPRPSARRRRARFRMAGRRPVPGIRPCGSGGSGTCARHRYPGPPRSPLPR